MITSNKIVPVTENNSSWDYSDYVIKQYMALNFNSPDEMSSNE